MEALDEKKAKLITELQQLTAAAQRKMLASISNKKLVLTRQLQNSIRTEFKYLESQAIYQITIGFEGYGRLKDLRRMQPGFDFEAMLKFVQEVGVEKFAYIPGYNTDVQRRKPIDKTRADKKTEIRRKGKGWFNPIKGKLEFDLMRTVSQQLALAGHKMVRETLQTTMGED
jgi:predicted membrane metal-binding protein